MSLIADALKTAQRERQRRESGADRITPSPLLVPLRTRPAAQFSWKRTLVIGGAGAMVLASLMLVLQRGRTGISARVAPASVLQSASEPPTADATSPAPRPASVTSDAGSAPRRDTARVATARTSSRVRASAPIVSPAATQTAPVTAAPPAAAAPDTAARVVPQESASSGRLRIAVERPRDAEAARLFAIGVAAHHAGDFPGARAAYESVLELTPSDVDALNNLALVLLAMGDAPRAETLLQRALRLAPGNAGAWSNLGTVLRARGRQNEAIAAFQHVLSIDPQNEQARVNIAQEYVALGSLDQARGILMELVASNPQMAEAHYTLGQVLEAQGDIPAAIRAYTEFIRTAPQRLAGPVALVRQHLDTLATRVP